MSVSSPFPGPPSLRLAHFDSALPTAPAPSSDSYSASLPDAADGQGNRSFLITWILSLTLGFLGADRFYTGRYLTGGLKLLSLGGLGLWWIVDLVIVMAGGLRYDRRRLRGYDAAKESAWIVTGFFLIVGYSFQLDELIAALLRQLL